MIRVIGVPFDYCGRHEGSRMGPSALRLAGLLGTLRGIGNDVADEGDVSVPSTPDQDRGLHHFDAFMDVAGRLRSAVGGVLDQAAIPIVLGGDHSLAVASISAALERCGSDLAVLWIDAHADVNTPATSPSGNLHGMPLAAVLGLPSGTDGLKDAQWRRIQSEIVPDVRLRSDRASWIGLRDIDGGERDTFVRLQSEFTATMHDIDRYGVVETVSRLDRWLRASGAKKLWISFDVDCLDPVLAPGTGTAVRGGFTYRESHLLAELLCERMAESECPYRLLGLDVVETNPILDTNNMTAVTAVEWIASLFGKTILGKR